MKRRMMSKKGLVPATLGFLFACSSTVSHPPTVPVIPQAGATEHLNPNCKANSNAGGQGTWTWTSTAVTSGVDTSGATANSPANGVPAAASSTPPNASGQSNPQASSGNLALDDSSGATTVTWSDIKGVLAANCMGSCHQHDNYSDYATAAAQAPEMVQRTDLDPTDPQFMPQGGQKLDLGDREKLIQWVGENMPDDSGATGTATSTATDTGQARFTSPQQGTTNATPQPAGC